MGHLYQLIKMQCALNSLPKAGQRSSLTYTTVFYLFNLGDALSVSAEEMMGGGYILYVNVSMNLH